MGVGRRTADTNEPPSESGLRGAEDAEVVGIRVGGLALRATLSSRGVARLEVGAGPEAAPTRGLAAALADELAEYFAGRRTRFSVPVDLSACTPFQRRVLEACARVPAGSTTTYAALARDAGCAGAARAVGTALARNPVLILVPCHRVLRADGGLGGFLAGPEWKRRLLALEGVVA